MLTKKQLKELETVIKQRFLALQWEMFGETVLTPEEIAELQEVGLLRSTVRNFTGDAYALGKIVSLVDREAAKGLTYEQVMKRVKDMAIPTTGVETAAIDWASTHAGQYIQGLSDGMVKEVRAASARVSGAAIRAVQDNVAEAIRNRKTISELKTSLMSAIDNAERDWTRVAFTEMNESIQRGVAHEIRKHSPPDGETLVGKRPAPDACKHCVRLYLEDDQITPKVFKLSDLEESNVGRKVADWVPTIGSIHPWCQCQLHTVPEGFSFVKREREAREPLAVDGEEGKERGTEMDAILEYTGETANLSVRKSLTYSDRELDHTEEDHICGY